MSRITDIVDAVAAELNTGVAADKFSLSFVAARHYVPRFNLEDMADLHVTIVPRGVEQAKASRVLLQSDVQVDVAVQKKLDACSLAEVDELMGLVEEISDFLRTNRLSACSQASWVRAENVPVYSQEHLDQYRQFTSVVTLTFRVMSQ